MARINGTLTFVDKNGDDKSIVRVIENLPEVNIGNHISNDIMIKSKDIEELHCRIFFNEKINRILIKNYSTSHPTLVNNQVVDSSKELKNGDVITILENSMRWETKDDAKRRISFLSKDERRAMKRKYIKTNKRITIHSVSVQSMLGSSPEEGEAAAGSSSAEKFSTPETLESTPESAEEFSSPVKEPQQSVLKDIENEKTPVKVNKLNMSGTLLTSYTPPVGKLTRSVSKPLWNSPLRSPLVKSAAKSILNDSLNVSKVGSSPQRLNNSQMHLIDLTTPFVKRTESTSTPKTSSIRKTPRTIGKTPLRNATLLKSAIKNSSIQKQVMQNISGIATKGKQLFDSPAESNTSSLIEISMSSISEIDSSKSSINDNSNCEVQKVEEKNGKTTTDEVKEILESIDSVLGENRGSEAVSEPVEVISSSQEIDDDFNKIVDNQKLSIGSANESLFDKALHNVPIEDINNFDKLLTDEGTSSTDDPEKKGEIVMKMIEKARESLSTPNKTTQVLSARYSDITNDSLTDSANTSQKYDATTPKISLLETVMSGRKSELTMGPVSRLSLTKDSTEIVENYQLNSNNSESLRSTRKRMRTAMSSIGILNSSQSADTTLNDSLNASVNTNHDQVDLNQSQPEETNILSLDNQPDMNTSNKENEYSGSLNMSMKFVEYSEFDENNRESKKIFELSDDGNDMIESDNESDSESDEDESPNEDILDEPLDDEILDENNQVDSNNLSTKKCRISQADLESLGEDGIDILEQSKDEDELAEMLDEADAEIKDVPESVKSEEITENNGVGDSEIIPEEEGDSNGISDFDVIPETQQMELEEEITEEEVPLDKSEYLDDIPATQQLDFGMEEALDSNSTLDAIVEALESTKESNASNEPQSLENIQQDNEQDELPINNEDVMDETVEDKQLDEINENEQLDETVEDKEIDETIESDQLENTVDNQLEESFAEDVEIPATQAFEFDDSIVEERLDESIDENVSLKVEVSEGKFSSIGSVISVDDSTIISSQDPVNKSDTAESISIQEISDSSEICSQESIVAKEESNTQPEDNTDENEIVNKSVAEATCTAQNSKETMTSLDSNVSETINELIAAPTDILTSIAIVQQYSTSEIGSDHMEIPATQEMLDDDEFDNDETVEEKTVEGDSAIGTTSSKIDQSNESEEKRVVDDSFTAETPNQNRESVLFSDTEFSNVEINASAFMKESDSDDFPEIKNNKELTDNETNQPQSDIIEEDNSKKQKELIEKELDNVDFEKKIIRKGYSILPTSEHEKPSGSRQTIIPEKMDDSFAALLEDKQKELKESELFETEAVQDDIVTKNYEIEITSSVNEEKMNEIEMELARMNDEPMTNIEKKRPASMMPQFEDGEHSDRVTSRMTMIPSVDNRRPSFIVCLEEEKAEVLKQKESVEFIEEKPKLFNDDEKEAQESDELNSDNNKEKEPVVEEPCIQKQAYVTTESEKQITAPETPSRRRVARVNYSELATGSPARSRRGRSASTESNGEKEKEPKSAVKHKEKVIKMEPIVEDELSVQITVTATKNNEQLAESSEETPAPNSEEIPMEKATEMVEKEPENMAIDENIEEVPVEEYLSEQDANEEIANGQNNVLENITDDTEEKSNEPELSVEHSENLQLMEVPKPENLQLMEVPTPDKLQVMEVTKPDRLQVVEVKTPSREHPKDSDIKDITNNADTSQKENDISEPVCEELIPETENIDSELPTEEEVDESEPIEEVVDEIEDEIIESTEKDDSEPVEEVTDEIIEKESVESIQEETVQNVDAKPEVEISSDIDEIVQISEEEVPSESVSQEEIAPKSEEVVIEPQTPSRKRAKKLNYLELASGSPARTPRRGRAASTEEKQEKSSKLDLPTTISEEIIAKDEEVVTSTHDGLISKEVTEELKEEEAMPKEVKKKPGRARKIDQLKPDNNEDVPTPSKRSRRGATPVQAPVNEPEKKSRKRQPKAVEPEPEKSHDSEVQGDEVIALSSTESIQEAAKPVAKKGRGKQAKVVDEDKHDEKTEDPQPVKKGRGRKAKVDETPIVAEKMPEKVETSPKRGRGRKAVVESHEEEAEKVTETPVAKKSRKRQHDKPAETEIPKETEDIKTDETAEVTVKSPQPIKKRNRVAKATEDVEHVEEHVQPEKAAPKRGRKGKIETVPEVQEQQKEEIAPKKTGRKVKTEDVIETHEEPAVQEAPKKGRGRKKVEEAPKEAEIEHEKVEESAPKRTGRKGKNDVAEHPVHEQTTEESVPKRAGRKGKLETLAAEIHDNQVHETPKRGRKAKVDATPIIQEQPQQVEEVVPKKGGRRGKAEVVAESQDEPVVQEAPKKGRGRKKVEETPQVDEPESSNVQEEAVPVKKGRGRQAKVVEKVIETKTDETAEVEAPKRGRTLKHKVVEPDTTDEPIVKKGRGRQAKQEVVSTTEEPEIQPIETPKRAKTPAKKNVAAKHVTIITPSTMQAHHSKETAKSEEPVVVKRATKRQAQPVIVEEEPVPAKRSTRVRK